jgi:hypothetical protein
MKVEYLFDDYLSLVRFQPPLAFLVEILRCINPLPYLLIETSHVFT